MKVSENKPHSIHLRLTDKQYEYCVSNAELMGVGVSDFVRMTINGLMVSTERMNNAKLGDLYANKTDNQ